MKATEEKAVLRRTPFSRFTSLRKKVKAFAPVLFFVGYAITAGLSFESQLLKWLGLVLACTVGVYPQYIHEKIIGLGIKQALGLEKSSIVALRVALALGAIVDCVFRWSALRDFYTDNGVIPRDIYIGLCRKYQVCDYDFPATVSQQSFHFIGGSYMTQLLIWLVHIMAACCMAIGWHTKMSSCIVYFLTESLHMRNHFMNDKGAMTLRVYLFWNIFQPTIDFGSVDACIKRQQSASSPIATQVMKRSKKGTEQHHLVLSHATAAFCIQAASIYWFSIIYKMRVPGNSWYDGSALEISMGLINYKKYWSQFLVYDPNIAKYLTWGAVVIESVVPFLFMPFFVHEKIARALRTIAAVSFLGFHLSIAQTIDIGIFPYISCLPFVAFLPSELWNVLANRCHLNCIISNIALFLNPAIVIDLQDSPKGKVSPSGSKFRASQVYRAPIETYGTIRKQLWFGQSVIRNSIVWVSLVFVLCWNIGYYDKTYLLPESLREVGALFGLRQHWMLFTDLKKGYDDCRVTLAVQLNNDKERSVNFADYYSFNQDYQNMVYNPQSDFEISTEKFVEPIVHPMNHTIWHHTELPYLDYPNYHWKTYLLSVRYIEPLVAYTGDFVCSSWNTLPHAIRISVDGSTHLFHFTVEQVRFGDAAKRLETFCMKQNIVNDDCNTIYNVVTEVSRKLEATDWYFLNICQDKVTKSRQRGCWDSETTKMNPIELSIPGLR